MKVILKVAPNREGAAEAKSLCFGEGDSKVELQFNATLIWPLELAQIISHTGEQFDIIIQA
jgi:hypothetical protein